MVAVEATVTDKGQTTIPKKIRDELGLNPGSKIVFILQDDGNVSIQPKKTSAREIFARFRGKIEVDEQSVNDFRMSDMI